MNFILPFMIYLLEILDILCFFSIIIHLNVFNIICVVFLKKYTIDLIFQFFSILPYAYYIPRCNLPSPIHTYLYLNKY